MKKSTLIFIVLIVLISCQPPKSKVDLLITNASIVNLTDGTIQTGKLIGIVKDSIVSINDMDDFHKYQSRQLIDSKDKFIMPGLWDNHVHFRGGDSLIQENKDLLPLFISHGVTAVRDAGGDISNAVLQWRDSIRQGALLGPTIFTSGPKLDGPDPAWEGSIAVTSSDDIKMAIDSLRRLKVDYVKIYDGSLSEELYYELIKETEAHGLMVTGHKPEAASLMKAAGFGLDGIEHAGYLLMTTSGKGDSLGGYEIKDFDDYINRTKILTETFDSAVARKNLNKLASGHFFVTPTAHIIEVLRDIANTDHSKDPLLSYIGPGIQDTYNMRINSAKRLGEKFKQYMSNEFEYTMKIYPYLNESGISILAGSDCGPFNSHVYPGSSLHSELQLMVKAGLTPLQALQTSVVNGPKFFGLEEYYGNVAVGKVADLIILDKNPLENIANTRSISMVIQGTDIHDSEKINQLLLNLKHN